MMATLKFTRACDWDTAFGIIHFEAEEEYNILQCESLTKSLGYHYGTNILIMREDKPIWIQWTEGATQIVV